VSPRRAPSAPPELPGFTYERYLGGGGFADVFLYEQQRPRRKVAVKVLLDSMLSPAASAAFDDEADLMAQLSSHPSIVTIYEVGRSPDGRPYLAMQFCPGANLGEKYRTAPLSVPDALRTGVEIASAVETAHRAGILHRDIKPHNILVTEYNEPLLTDFGIASTLEGGAATSEGMSIPWSPPESFDDPPVAGLATDVWALGATVYSLLAGRSPFELPGGPNSSADLITRIETARPAPTGRADVPESLERVLATAMGRTPAQRYPSALAFARALQQIQDDLGFGATPLSIQDDVVDRTPEPEQDDDDPGTRIRRIQVIDPTGPPPVATGPPAGPRQDDAVAPSSTTGPVGRTVRRGEEARWARAPEPPPVEATVHRQEPETEPEAAPAPDELPRSRARLVALASVAVVLVAAVVVAMLLGGGGDGASAAASAPPTVAPADNLTSLAPAPTDVTATREGDLVVFTWTDPDPRPGDTYLWRLLTVTDEEQLQAVDAPTVSVPVQDGQTCIEVYLVRGSKASVESARGCL